MNRYVLFIIAIIIAIVSYLQWSYSCPAPTLTLIPSPSILLQKDGCIPTAKLSFSTETPDILKESLYPYISSSLQPTVTFRQDSTALYLGKEGYTLSITTNGVAIVALTDTGIFYGTQTLRQLLTLQSQDYLPLIEITDIPSSSWRGLLIDVARHFLTVEEMKDIIDRMASLKLNRLQWHLVDDQGWRIELPSHPELTRIGSSRSGTHKGLYHYFSPPFSDEVPYQKYYTTTDIKEIVAYAQQRHIMIIPEISMPGHTAALLASYPHLSSTNILPQTRIQWGIHHDMVDLSEATFQILQSILKEVSELFPSKYIHIGADEMNFSAWENSTKVQQQMQRLQVHTTEEAASYFFGRVAGILNELERIPVGWDEALEYLPVTSLITARFNRTSYFADANQPLIIASQFPLYFDYRDIENIGFPTISDINSTSILPTIQEVYQQQQRYSSSILGFQGQLWSEYMPSYMYLLELAYPRLYGLAEINWSPVSLHNSELFIQRLTKFLQKIPS